MLIPQTVRNKQIYSETKGKIIGAINFQENLPRVVAKKTPE